MGSQATPESSEALRWLWQVPKFAKFCQTLVIVLQRRQMLNAISADWMFDAGLSADVRGGGLRCNRPERLAESNGGNCNRVFGINLNLLCKHPKFGCMKLDFSFVCSTFYTSDVGRRGRGEILHRTGGSFTRYGSPLCPAEEPSGGLFLFLVRCYEMLQLSDKQLR